MKAEKSELNHAECVDRELAEWKKIFSLSEKAYGYRINAYKGKQTLVYIPDMIDGKKAVVFKSTFPPECAVICNRRLFDRCSPVIQFNSVRLFLREPDAYPDAYASVVNSFISKNKDLVVKELIKEDDAASFDRFLQLFVKHADTNTITSFLKYDGIGIQVKSYLLDKTALDPTKVPEISVFDNALDEDDFSVSKMKKLWQYKKAEDGTIILTGYKGNDTVVQIPGQIGRCAVTSIADYALSSERPRSTPEQKRAIDRIVSVAIPEGICALGEKVFCGNMQIENVQLPKSVTAIGNNAFRSYRGPASITIHAPAGSYAEQYAKENGIPFVAE